MNRLDLAPSAPALPRPAAVFPAADGGTVAWFGGPAALRTLAADHVDALGAQLVDVGPDDPAPAIGLGSLAVLARRGARAGGASLAGVTIALGAAGEIAEEHWRACLELGVRAVVRLPEDSARLLDLLAAALRRASRALVIGVVGGCGGAGASSLAARLAGAATRGGAPTVLVDADPLGGGLDVLVEAAGMPGARWEDVGHLGGDDGATLRDGLPVVDGVRLLVAGHGAWPTPEQTVAVLGALAPLAGTVVVDLGPLHVDAVLDTLDHLVLIVPATDHAVRSTGRRLRAWRAQPEQTRLVVRRRGRLAPGEVAESLGLGLAAAFRDGGKQLVPLLDVRRRGADAVCTRLLRAMALPGGVR